MPNYASSLAAEAEHLVRGRQREFRISGAMPMNYSWVGPLWKSGAHGQVAYIQSGQEPVVFPFQFSIRYRDSFDITREVEYEFRAPHDSRSVGPASEVSSPGDLMPPRPS